MKIAASTPTPIHEDAIAKAILETARSIQRPSNLAEMGKAADGKA